MSDNSWRSRGPLSPIDQILVRDAEEREREEAEAGDPIVAYTSPNGMNVCMVCAATWDPARGELTPVRESEDDGSIFTNLASHHAECSRCDRALAEAFYETKGE